MDAADMQAVRLFPSTYFLLHKRTTVKVTNSLES